MAVSKNRKKRGAHSWIFFFLVLDELKGRFSFGDAIAVFKSFNNLFDYLPLAALVVDRILCMHGGISPKLKTLDSIRKVCSIQNVKTINNLHLDTSSTENCSQRPTQIGSAMVRSRGGS